MKSAIVPCLSLVCLCAYAQIREGASAEPPPPRYLYVWAQAVDTTRGSFLAVIDLAAAEGERLVRMVPVEGPSRGAHHTEHELSAEGFFFANAFDAGRTFLFDLRKAAEPKIVASIGDVGPFSHPHSYARMSNGHVIATFQWRVNGALPGGLVELDHSGKPVRWASAASTEVDSSQIVPYSLAILPGHDRIVSTSTHMIEDIGVHVQTWRLSDLKLLRTLPVPIAGEHRGHDMHDSLHHRLPGEPRLLADGRTVMFGTFTCGLYHVTGIESDQPRIRFSYAFPGADCAVPVVVGKYWIQTVPALHALIALDVSDPARPVEASRVVFDDAVKPHWLAADPTGRLLVTTSASRGDPALHLIDFDPESGVLTRRSNAPAVALRAVQWPDGYTGDAIPHGAVFSR